MKRKTAAFVLILLTAGLLAVLFSLIDFRTESDRILSIYQGKRAPLPGYHASLFGHSLEPYVTVIDPTDYEIPGDYDVTYELRLFSLPVRTLHVLSTVADVDAPLITMKEDVICFTRLNAPWSLPEYKVTDNYNTEDEITVSISEEADHTREGVYEASLTACDASGNCSFKPLTVVVGKGGEEDMEPGKFNLFRLAGGRVLLRPREDKRGNAVYDELYWMGDSNILNLGKYNGVESSRVLARYGMTPATFAMPLYYDNRQTNANAAALIGRLKPNYLLLMMGEAEAASGNPIALAEHYYACIQELQEASPDTKIIVSAILPVCRNAQKSAADQKAINRANYCLLRMCEEHELPMICANDWLMGKDGYGNPEYYNEDGFHLRAANFDRYTGYVRSALNSVMSDF